jgi:flavin-dependent dehydrogenase
MRSSPRRYDAVIVGGGPAGSTTAIELSKQGWHIVLLERGGRHRDKACGHCLNPRALDLLGRIGWCEFEGELAPPPTHQLCVHSADGRSSRVAMDRPGRLVERRWFDQRLRDTAASHGVEVRHETSAIGFGFSGEGASVRVRSRHEIQEVRTRLVIGADGLGSSVARASGLTDACRQGRKLGFSFDWCSSCTALPDTEAIHMYLESDGGYLGVACHANRTIHVAGLIQPPRGASTSVPPRHPVEWVRSLANRHHALRDLSLDDCHPHAMLRFCAAGPMPWRTTAVAASHLALVGDAAG